MNGVIVTGATSMLGIATIQECIKNNVKVVALSRAGSRRRKYLPQSNLLTLIECDLKELRSIDLPKGNYDILYHFAWGYTDRTTRDDPVLQSKNIEFTLDAVELAKKCGCKKFLGAGSQAEYGFHNGIITEDTPVMPGISYGYAKYAAGKLAEKLCSKLGIICIWTRIFSVYGKYDGENTMIPYAFHRYKNDEVAYFSSGKQMWDYLFEEDAGKYLFLLGKKVEKSILVNVASGNVRPLREYIEDMAKVLGEKNDTKRFRYELEESGKDSLNGIHPDISRLCEMTGYTPQIDFAEGIRRIKEFMLEERDIG